LDVDNLFAGGFSAFQCVVFHLAFPLFSRLLQQFLGKYSEALSISPSPSGRRLR